MVLCILGTGKMAEDIGLFFLKKGVHVNFVSSNKKRCEEYNDLFIKKYKRLCRVMGDDLVGDYSIVNYDSLENVDCDYIIESTTESLEAKKEVIRKIRKILPHVTCYSNSSSIEPGQLDDNTIGLHFFYPVELTKTVEVIDDKKQMATSFAEKFDLKIINEEDLRKFLVNRLLLPLQNESLRLLKSGYGRDIIDSSSTSELLMTGQLSMLDSIGLDTVKNAAVNYLAYLDEKDRNDFSFLLSGLDELINLGVKGKKSEDSIMTVAELPWKRVKADMHPRIPFNLLLINTCFNFIEKSITDLNELDMIFSNIFMSDISFKEHLKNIDFEKSKEALEKLYTREGLSYFKPSLLWKRADIKNG